MTPLPIMDRSISTRMLTRLVIACQDLSKARDMERVMAIVRTAARELVGADGATFVLRDRIGEDEFCYYADEDAIGPLWKGSRFPVSSCISGWAMLNRRSVTIPDIYLDDRIPAELYKPTFVRGLAMVPIRAADPLGAIGTYWQNEHAPSPDELYVLEALADITAVTIELVRSYTGLERRVEERTAELHHRNMELMDNIAYAQRVQAAMLPPPWLISGLVPQHFIIYRPKDVVSGDFYWIDDRNGLVFVAVADCTGHGVTGAFLSIMCTNILNRVVNEFGITETGVMLDKARQLVGEAFSKGQGLTDGMDITLCAIDMRTKEVAWSGAHSDLWYVSDGRLMVLKAHNQPIGRSDMRTGFPTHRVQLAQGDMLYLMSDGFVDQFGGPKGKKFRSRPLRELVLRLHDRSMPEQRFLLEHAFDAWRGSLEQVDDVTILGIRL